MNIAIEYRYRDSGNYKKYHEAIFSNPENIPLDQITKTIQAHLIDGEFFYAAKWNLPEILTEYANPVDDPSWHELVAITETNKPATEAKTILVWLQAVTSTHLNVNLPTPH